MINCCDNCKYLEKLNENNVYAKCMFKNQHFNSFGSIDTRLHSCEFYEYKYNEMECSYNKFIKCPYCGYEDYEKDDFNINMETWECSECGEEFNINSPKQLGDVLFDELNLNISSNKKKRMDYKKIFRTI